VLEVFFFKAASSCIILEIRMFPFKIRRFSTNSHKFGVVCSRGIVSSVEVELFVALLVDLLVSVDRPSQLLPEQISLHNEVGHFPFFSVFLASKFKERFISRSS